MNFSRALVPTSVLYIALFLYSAPSLTAEDPRSTTSTSLTSSSTTTTVSSRPPATKNESDAKLSILHDLRMKNIRANREYGIRLNLVGVESFCLRPDTSVLDCSKEAQLLDNSLTAQMTQAELLRQQQRANDLKERELEQSRQTTIIQHTERNIYLQSQPRPTYPPVTQPVEPPRIPRDPWTGRPVYPDKK